MIINKRNLTNYVKRIKSKKFNNSMGGYPEEYFGYCILHFIMKNKRIPPSLASMSDYFSGDAFRKQHNNIKELIMSLRKEYPEIIKKYYDITLFDEEDYFNMVGNTKNSNRYVITTASLGKPVMKPFLNALKKYCAKNDAELLILLAASGVSTVGGWSNTSLDKCLLE